VDRGDSVAVAVFERVVHDLRLSSGVCRTTYRGRFELVDHIVNDVLDRFFATDAPLEIHDWAASDCLAASEWAQTLFQRFPRARFIASDLILELLHVQHSTRLGTESFIFEPGAIPLQYVRPPFVVALNRPRRSRLPINRAVQWWALRQVPAARRAALMFEEQRPLPGRMADTDWSVTTIPLVHPDALAFSDANRNFKIVRHSVFESLPRSCDVIRTMNIFNRSYFDDRAITQGAQAVGNSLRVGGVWILGQTGASRARPTTRVTIFRNTSDGFKLIERVGKGSEVEELVLGLRSASVPSSRVVMQAS
jgi:hypothetical protein